MRTANFRDEVLWAIAIKLGLDPRLNLLPDHAEALVSFINGWVRRMYNYADFPDLTVIQQFEPDGNHMVGYEPPPEDSGNPFYSIWKVLKNYLLDPVTNNYQPIDYPFRLMENGVHVG